MKVVLLAGGLGTRLREQTEFRPKPMVEVGGRPVLWHIMKLFGYHGHNEFVVCAGYRGEVIKDYFMNFESRTSDFTVHLGSRVATEFHGDHDESDWSVTVVDTGADTMTGGRVKKIQPFTNGERIVVTYGDGLSDVDIGELLAFHERHGRLATVTTVHPPSRFGIMDIEKDGRVVRFREKPISDDFVNAGFFVFEPEVFEYLTADCVLEREPLEALAKDGQLFAHRHEGYFQPMDTYREFEMLNALWSQGSAPWKVWS